MSDIGFPPLMAGLAVEPNVDPFENACARSALGCDPGLVVHTISDEWLRAAIVFAPEVPLADATAMLPACGIGFQNALGALAPPEVAVHLEWQGGILVNGAHCGSLTMAASTDEAEVEPDWLVVGLAVPLRPGSENPGQAPDKTSLYEEGCAEIDPERLLESWAKHTLVWINRWSADGVEPLHAVWRGLAHNLGEEIEINGRRGTFVGVDEQFGMLLRHAETTELLPLTTLLKDRS